jgi:superfamily I DNA/RNA helicase
VGDTKQKIMGWAGALEGIFLKFGEDFGATSLNLYQNFRSLHRIRRVHNRMVTDIDPEAAVPDEQIDRNEGEVACKSFNDDEAEAEWIAASIEQWHLEGIAYAQFAILCNTQPHLYAQKIMTALDQRGIPYRNEQQVQDLCSEPLFRLVFDFLLILLGDAEPDAWERFRRILDQDSSEADIDANGRDWDGFIRSSRGSVGVEPDAETAWLVVRQMLDKLGMESLRGLSHDYENQTRVNELLASIKEHVIASFGGGTEPVGYLKSIGSAEAVRILTIHKCKGLEFHTVIVQGVEAETFFGTKQDSECGFFVAISRAKERLVTTFVEHREKLPGANRHWKETRTAHKQFLSYVEPENGGSRSI